MIKSWYSSIAIDLAKMVDVTDEMIRENSNGVVNRIEPDEDDLEEGEKVSYDNTLVDTKIFGAFGEENLDMMGHIDLPVPVVNIHYTRGKCPELHRVLGMSLKELDRLIYVSGFIRKEDDWSKNIPIYSYHEWQKDRPEGTFLTSADAIEALLQYKGIDPSRYILRALPVMPLCMRYMKCEEGTKAAGSPAYMPTDLDSNYRLTVLRANRVKTLLSMPNIPELIMVNEKRELQYKVDQLICNGTVGIPVAQRNGIPRESLDDLYDRVTEITPVGLATNPKFEEDFEEICNGNTVKDLWKKYEDIAYEVSYDDDGYKELSYKPLDERQENDCDAAFNELITYLTPFVKIIHDKYFSAYEWNEKEVPSITEQIITGALEYWNPEKITAAKRLWKPIMYSLEYHYRKRAMWEGEKH